MEKAALHYEMIQTRGLKFEVSTHGEGDRLALLLHGFPESAYSYRYQIPLLTRLGYRVWAPNLRGYGKSDKPLGRKAYTTDVLEGDISDLIDASGARSVLLVGHDWGGALAWSYAMHGTRPIERLVCMNCPHPALFRRALQTSAQLRRSWYMFLFQVPYLPELLIRARSYEQIEKSLRGWAVHKEHFSDEDIAIFKQSAAEPGALTAMLNWYRAMPYSMQRMQRRGGAQIRVPTLFLWGEQDQALGKELTYGTDRFVDKLTLRYIPDASHWVQQDTPEIVNQLLEDWLTEPQSEQRKTRQTQT